MEKPKGRPQRKKLYRIVVVFEEGGTPRRLSFDETNPDLNYLKGVVEMWMSLWAPDEDGTDG